MRIILLTFGQVALVDDEDFPRLSKHKWFADWNEKRQRFYAARNGPTVKCMRGTKIYMHREIMGLTPEVETEVDHIEPRATLNNQKSNLRYATRVENQFNKRAYRTNTSGYKGVHWDRVRLKWRASIQVRRRSIFIGRFNSKKAAILAYRKAATEHHGEFARFA